MRQFLPLGLIISALALTTSCSTGSSEVTELPATGLPQSPPSQQTSARSPVATSQPGVTSTGAPVSSVPVASGEFSFPQATCGGDSQGSTNATWYPVFLDGGDLQEVRQNLCRDAISKVRSDTGVNTVQLASFTDYEEAKRFADTVKGSVGQPSNPNISASDSPTQSTQLFQAWAGVLVAEEPSARINLRRAPSTQSTARGYGLVGDRVTVTDQAQDGGDYAWYKVRFSVSGAVGWVRSDFVQAENQPETTSASSNSSGYTGGSTYPTGASGRCQHAWQVDASGKRCGGRAASERVRGSSGGGRTRSTPRRRR
jgi:uncharacterized protein YgiM (DUF1202 family)